MSVRLFIGLQLLMFLVLSMVGSQLDDVGELIKGIVLNFAVFYLTAMLVGYRVRNAPFFYSLAVCMIFYLIIYFLGGTGGVSATDQAVDVATALFFIGVGTRVGVYSRPQPQDQDIPG